VYKRQVAYGAADFLKETWNDNYFVAVCNKTGGIAVYNPDKNLFISPLADGPIRFIDSLDGKHMNIERVTHFGRTFSIIRVPYAFKLLMQELQSINVKMRIVTEDNIDQFECMQFSKTVKLRLQEDLLVKETEDKESKKKAKESDEKESEDKELDDKEDKEDKELENKESENKESENKESENKESELIQLKIKESLPNEESSINEEFFKPSQDSIQHTETKTYNVGDAVHFKGDFKHSRVWMIEEFDKGFAILKTEDIEGLDNSRKVVPLDDIVHVLQETLLNPPQKGGADTEMLPKGFSPVFNIVTGNDNKIEAPPSINMTQKNEAESFADNLVKDDNTFVGGTFSSPKKETDFNKPLIKSDKQLMSGGAIVIKKLS
jgi:flagellar biosynthesis GTPase FlhF